MGRYGFSVVFCVWSVVVRVLPPKTRQTDEGKVLKKRSETILCRIVQSLDT